jgi:hypothetical protein
MTRQDREDLYENGDVRQIFLGVTGSPRTSSASCDLLSERFDHPPTVGVNSSLLSRVELLTLLSQLSLGVLAMARNALGFRTIGFAAASAVLALSPDVSRADESGISFWLPGLYGSLAATPTTPGWSLGAIYYHTTVNASGAAAAAREVQIGRFPLTSMSI